MKAISYALFGYNKVTPKNCFEFNSYLRGLMVNIRINRIIYPDWVNVLETDNDTYEGNKELFRWLQDHDLLTVHINQNDQQLCKAMLWRLNPVFDTKDGGWKYSHVLCRDIDSVCTYREVQAVNKWIEEDKTLHCITDSVSHNIPMMGGMIGVRPTYFSSRLGVNSWSELMDKYARGFDFSVKGSDQDFMNRMLYPKLAESSTEHFIKGMPHNLSEGNGRHYIIEDIDIGIDEKYKELNHVCGHIGSAGYYEIQMLRFLNELDPYKEEYEEIEKQYPKLFYWHG
jgi:hypothetical protein